MSGTSLDGIDGVLVEDPGRHTATLSSAGVALPADLRAELLALNTPGGIDELHRAALAANAMARLSADLVGRLLSHAGIDAGAVTAIGAHGQTVRHQPGRHDGTGYTLQINQPALLAELTGIAVVADFRSRDVAAGGQGAPLAPAFHAALFARPDRTRAVLNLGGIANLTRLVPGEPPAGFDCGPANVLMDLWIRQHRGQSFDCGGDWAASGQVLPALLTRLLAEPYFGLPPPKSTGRDLFNLRWLQERLTGFEGAAPADVQATLAELTARVVAAAVRGAVPDATQLLVCGGGALNTNLMSRLAAHLSGMTVSSSHAAGVPPTQVEAVGFAWLARCTVEQRALELQKTTGARGARVLGAVWPA